MTLSTVEMGKVLGISRNRVVRIKLLLGYGKGSSIDSSQVEVFRQMIPQLKTPKRGKTNPEYDEYYQKCLKIIEKQGYISRVQLTEIFKMNGTESALSYFELKENPLYDEEEYIMADRQGRIKKRKRIVYKLVKPVFEKWREENKHNGLYNNSCYQGGLNI